MPVCRNYCTVYNHVMQIRIHFFLSQYGSESRFQTYSIPRNMPNKWVFLWKCLICFKLISGSIIFAYVSYLAPDPDSGGKIIWIRIQACTGWASLAFRWFLTERKCQWEEYPLLTNSWTMKKWLPIFFPLFIFN